MPQVLCAHMSNATEVHSNPQGREYSASRSALSASADDHRSWPVCRAHEHVRLEEYCGCLTHILSARYPTLPATSRRRATDLPVKNGPITEQDHRAFAFGAGGTFSKIAGVRCGRRPKQTAGQTHSAKKDIWSCLPSLASLTHGA